MRAQDLADRLGARPQGAGWIACCPAHEDHHPSLSIADGELGVLVYCHSRGCSIEAICRALRIAVGELFYEPAKGLAIHAARRASLRSLGSGWWHDRKTATLWVASNGLVHRLRADAAQARAAATRLGDTDEGWRWAAVAARLEQQAALAETDLDRATE